MRRRFSGFPPLSKILQRSPQSNPILLPLFVTLSLSHPTLILVGTPFLDPLLFRRGATCIISPFDNFHKFRLTPFNKLVFALRVDVLQSFRYGFPLCFPFFVFGEKLSAEE